MRIVLSLVAGFLLSGASQILVDLNTRLPGWTMEPTLGNAILAGLIWFIRPLLVHTPRAFVVEMLRGVVKMGIFSGFAWLCIAGATRIFDSTALQIVAATLFIAVGGWCIVVPFVIALLMPPFVAVIVLDLIFAGASLAFGIIALPINGAKWAFKKLFHIGVPKQTVGIRIVVAIYLVMVIGVCLYVPSYTINVPSYALRSGLKLEFAYRWVWALNYGLSIDFGRVVSELIGLTAVAGVPVLLLIGSLVSGRKRENNTTT